MKFLFILCAHSSIGSNYFNSKGEEGKEKRMIESQQYRNALHLCW
jgi:hypothetical protein